VILVFGGGGQLGQELARIAAWREVALTAFHMRKPTSAIELPSRPR
jgi:dTDP-4-dehydrorhamnose reductase